MHLTVRSNWAIVALRYIVRMKNSGEPLQPILCQINARNTSSVCSFFLKNFFFLNNKTFWIPYTATICRSQIISWHVFSKWALTSHRNPSRLVTVIGKRDCNKMRLTQTAFGHLKFGLSGCLMDLFFFFVAALNFTHIINETYGKREMLGFIVI